MATAACASGERQILELVDLSLDSKDARERTQTNRVERRDDALHLAHERASARACERGACERVPRATLRTRMAGRRYLTARSRALASRWPGRRRKEATTTVNRDPAICVS